MCETDSYLHGKVAIITGATSGVGLATAKQLAKRGARVVVASRNEEKLKAAVDEIKKETGAEDIAFRRIDLASLSSVRSFASETVMNEARLDILINNVGVVGLPDEMTADGLHVMMQVNYFGSFLLTYLLLPLLKASAPSRIVNVSASSMYIGRIDFDHMNDVGYWSTVNLLANAKLAQNLFMIELSERLESSNVTVNSYDPFLVAGTSILDVFPDFVRDLGQFVLQLIGRPKEDVARELAYIATDSELQGVSGKNFKFCVLWYNSWLTNDKNLTKMFWDVSKRLVKIKAEEGAF